MSMFANIALLRGGVRVRTWVREQREPVEAVRSVQFWLDHFSLKQKIKFLVGFDQCFTAWQRKSLKDSNNAATRYSVLTTTDCPWYRP